MWMEDEGIEFRHLIRDNYKKFPASFDQFFKELTGTPSAGGAEGGEDGTVARSPKDEAQDVHHKWNAVVNTSIRAPNMNAYCESFIGHMKAECLNYIFCVSRSQLNYVIKQYQDYHIISARIRARILAIGCSIRMQNHRQLPVLLSAEKYSAVC
ncbi:MAG: hypothetical protein JXR97_14770 [Planctomycetes bacterium]|nr:hypothetical protein [Planctomycetota bacterium]